MINSLKHIIIISVLCVGLGAAQLPSLLNMQWQIYTQEKSMKTKKCSICKKVKSIKYFWRSSHSKDGYLYLCIDCEKKRRGGLYEKIPNKYIHIDNGITKILINSPKYGLQECLIDTKNYKKIKTYSWTLQKYKNTFYVYHKFNDNTQILIHRFIMNAIECMEVDHADIDPLNNLESNLRLCTHSENNFNKRKSKNGTSQYKGVSYFKQGNRSKRWAANIKKENKIFRLGYFKTELDAAHAYDCACRILHGEFAHPNFPDKRIA